MNWLWSFMGFLGIGSILQELVNKGAIDYDEGELAGGISRRWVQWGTCRAVSRNPAHDFRYVLIRLPSWQWFEEHWSMPAGWYQHCMLKFDGNWRSTWMPE